MSHLLSVVILSWNRRDALRETLMRLRADAYEPREVIVVDNGSTDGSPDLVRAEFPEVRLEALPRNVGIEGLNVGIKAARGEIIVLLDDDSYPQPGALAMLAEAFRRDPGLGVAACRIAGPPGWWESKWPWAGLDAQAEVPTFIACGVGIRMETLARAGAFDGAFFLYQNELDLSARVVDAGYGVRYFPDIAFTHAVSSANRTSLREEYYGFRNLLWVVWKYLPKWQAVRLTGRLVAESVGYRLLRGDLARARTVARAARDAATGRPALPRRALSVPARRCLMAYIDLWYPPILPFVRRRLGGNGPPRSDGCRQTS
jgi:GT2 family glycosyltransferase